MPSGCVYEQSFIGTLLCPIQLGLLVVPVTQSDPQRLKYLLTALCKNVCLPTFIEYAINYAIWLPHKISFNHLSTTMK